MELLPNDIRQHTFSRGMRGYDRDEVEQFLEHVAEALEDALNGRREAEDKARRLKSEIERFKKLEESLKQAVVTAQRAMSQAQEASSAESESLKRAAQNEALSIVQEAESKRMKIEGDIHYLEQLRESHLQQFRGFLNAQLTTLEQMQSGPGLPAARKATAPAVAEPKPVTPKWESPRASAPPKTEFSEPETVAEPEADKAEPQPWHPERIIRDAAGDDEVMSAGRPDDDESEAVVTFPPPLVPGDDRRGE